MTVQDVERVGTAGVAVAQPEAPAIGELYHAYRLDLVRLAVLLLSDLESAEDVVQDAFASVYRKYGRRLGDLDNPQAYLRRAVVNGARSQLRRRRTARAWVPPHVPPGPSAEEDVIRAEQDVELRAAMRHLTRRQREVLVMRYWGGLSEAEMADALGISVGTVKSTASRALAALHRRLGAGGVR